MKKHEESKYNETLKNMLPLPGQVYLVLEVKMKAQSTLDSLFLPVCTQMAAIIPTLQENTSLSEFMPIMSVGIFERFPFP